MERMTRRDVLQMLAATPLTAAMAGCCTAKYPKRSAARRLADAAGARPDAPALDVSRGVLGPFVRGGRAADVGPSIVDPHAHFFNASDVPVKGFVEECLGHNVPGILQPLVRAFALIADRLADEAPTAAKELEELRNVVTLAPRGADAPQLTRARDEAKRQTDADREAVARKVVELLRERRGRRFEQEYLKLKRQAAAARPADANRGAGADAAADTVPQAVTEEHVKRVLEQAEKPTVGAPDLRVQPISREQAGADGADGLLAFLGYMLSMRRSNLESYLRTFTLSEGAIGIHTVFGALVDFDYWLDCPPRSSHAQQVEVHHLLGELYGDYFRPVVAYNPWTDIEQGGAGLTRVTHACKTLGFAAVKIYPPTGFMPAGNAGRPESPKPHPKFGDLDDALKKFFDTCATEKIPVIAHTAHSNGRDKDHDEFGGPDGWRALLKQYAPDRAPTIDFGHFGGGSGPEWTDEFSKVIKDHPHARLFADLGYWEELMCPGTTEKPCTLGKDRLKKALAVTVGDRGETIADRTMFATDWLMLSQVKRWADYPAALRATLREIAPDHADAIMGGNATRCFNLSTT